METLFHFCKKKLNSATCINTNSATENEESENELSCNSHFSHLDEANNNFIFQETVQIPNKESMIVTERSGLNEKDNLKSESDETKVESSKNHNSVKNNQCKSVEILPYEVFLLPEQLSQHHWTSSFTLSDHRPLQATFKFSSNTLKENKAV